MSEKSDKILEELGYTPAKSKMPQKQDLHASHGRDLFQTPNYAVDLLVPFLPKDRQLYIWECAAGEGKISNRLLTTVNDVVVWSTDIRETSHVRYTNIVNFIEDEYKHLQAWIAHGYNPMIITNPPFSLKQKFYEKCLEYEIPFALLIPADYSGWLIEACMNGAEKIIPTRRIDYLTPNTLIRIHEGEVFEVWLKERNMTTDDMKLVSMKQFHSGVWQVILNNHPDVHNYEKISDVPQELLAKYSSSDFHSMWLTKGFNLGRTETFVELSIKEKKENI